MTRFRPAFIKLTAAQVQVSIMIIPASTHLPDVFEYGKSVVEVGTIEDVSPHLPSVIESNTLVGQIGIEGDSMREEWAQPMAIRIVHCECIPKFRS